MKVVLKQDVKSIGKKDELHEVSDGYARNYLLPRGLAVAADAAAVNEVRTKAAASEHHAAEELANAQALAKKLNGQIVAIKAKAGQGGRLFGSVTSKDIAAALTAGGLPLSAPYGAAELAAAAMADKKRAGGEITLVLPRAIGRCELRRVPAAELEELARVAVGA